MVLPEAPSTQTQRLIDANLNRIGESLRLLEDVARLLLNNTTLTQQLKTMRHQLITADPSFNQQLLQARNSEGDVGINLEAPQQAKERELPEVVVDVGSRRLEIRRRGVARLEVLQFDD